VIKVEQKITILSLWKNGLSKREIGKKLNISKTTAGKWIRKYEKQGEKIFYEQGIDRDHAAAAYKDTILSWIEKEPKLSILRIWEKLREEKDYKHGYDSVRYFLKSLNLSKEIYPVFDISNPGEEAQVDFGYVGLIHDPEARKRKKAYVFCMRLIYSRYDYYEVVFDQKVKTFIK
jgi:transposase